MTNDAYRATTDLIEKLAIIAARTTTSEKDRQTCLDNIAELCASMNPVTPVSTQEILDRR